MSKTTRQAERVMPADQKCPLCGGESIGQYDDATGHYRHCLDCASDYASADESALNRKPFRCGGCADNSCDGRRDGEVA